MGPVLRIFAPLGLAGLLAINGCGFGSGEDTTSVAGSTSSSESAVAPDEHSYPTQTSTACDVLTARAAKEVLGTVGPASTPPPANASAGVGVSSCVRSNALSADDAAESASLLMRVARTARGAQNNAAVFASDSRPAGSQNVTGYGEKAFWNPAFGQLSILNEGNWYILAAGPINPRQRTLEDAKKLADAVKDKL
jgi:hypothetical protein